MGEYAILIVVMGLSVYIFSTVFYKLGGSEKYLEGYANGYNEAKHRYYDEPKKEQAEKEKEIRDMNESVSRVTSEVLMAYGVGSTSQLPKEVREHYGILDEDVHLQDLIEEEFNNGI